MFKSEDPACYKKPNQVSKTFVNVASLGTWTSLSKLNWKLWRLALTASYFHNHSIIYHLTVYRSQPCLFKAFFVWNKFQCKSWVFVPGLLTIKYIWIIVCFAIIFFTQTTTQIHGQAVISELWHQYFFPCGHNGLMVEFVNKILWYYPLNETFLAMYYFFSTLQNVKYINTSCIIFN